MKGDGICSEARDLALVYGEAMVSWGMEMVEDGKCIRILSPVIRY